MSRRGAPPMGWNSWNTFYDRIDESLIRSTAEAIADRGLLSAGYDYLIIDDCWALKERDEQGRLVPDPAKFPHGMQPVADYVHGKGLKLGLYGCCGVRTCAGYPGSFEHEFEDAEQFAQWGVDYLKYDNCHRPNAVPSHVLYRRMSLALNATGRDIFLAACQWGTEDVGSWIRSTGARSFRSTVDIQDSWKSIESITLSQLDGACQGTPGCANDMDMLVCGMYGKGMNPETSMGGCTQEEYRTHFALWAMLGAPLIIGCDVRGMDEETQRLLTNRHLIAIDQDEQGRACQRVSVYGNPDAFALVKPLAGGELAIGLFNFSDVAAQAVLDYYDIGLSRHAGFALALTDCFTGEELGAHRELFAATLPVHGCRVVRAKVVRV